MNFTNIPKNGASWSDELLYSFATELDTPSDVSIAVRDADSGELLGTMQLYAVVEATVNIAPIVRRSVDIVPPTAGDKATITRSRSMRHVVVEANGVASPTIALFRSSYSPLLAETLSSMTTAHGVAPNDTLRLTVNAIKVLNISVQEWRGLHMRTLHSVSYSAGSMPVEVVLPLDNLSAEAERVVVVVNNGVQSNSYEYRLVERPATTRTLLWYNTRGGIESYTFPYSRLVSRKADVASVESANGHHAWLNGAQSVVRLSSATLSRSEQARLAEIVRSPYIFEERDGAIIPALPVSRELRYDDHGALSRLSLDIVEEWKGGEL